MSDFTNKVLITDLDGTLLPISKVLSEKDMNAIERFRRGGGIFTIATGRIIQAAEQYFDALKPDAPVILNNGGLIYDTKKHEKVYDGIYVVNMTEWERLHLNMTHLKYTEASLDDIPKMGWCKVLYSMGGGKVKELSNYAAEMGWDKTSFVISGDFLFECLPKDCTKGSALKQLWEIEKWNTFTVAAAGDYDNDIEMLEFADVGIAPKNAQDIVKKSADYVTTATCEEGAIAEAIDYLEKL